MHTYVIYTYIYILYTHTHRLVDGPIRRLFMLSGDAAQPDTASIQPSPKKTLGIGCVVYSIV